MSSCVPPNLIWILLYIRLSTSFIVFLSTLLAHAATILKLINTMTSVTSKPCVLLIGTCDTKLEELLYVRSHMLQNSIDVKLMDVGRQTIAHRDIDYTHSEILSHLPVQPEMESMERGQIIETIASAASDLVHELYFQHVIAGAICIGGSGGTSLGASIMRSALPFGFPKLIVSTVASGNVSNFVGETDITMMHSVVDIAGQNPMLQTVLENAAGMICGAAKAYIDRLERRQKANENSDSRKKRVAITMFGVTTPAADAARDHLESNGYEVFVFHATGIGGRAMEKLILQHQVDGVLDLTTTELADELVGGVMNAGPDRLTGAARMGIPQVVSLGALDMVNFGPRETLPAQFAKRLIHVHNPDVTVVRTSVDECRILGKQLARKMRAHIKPNLTRMYIPLGGLSMLSVKGGPFYDEVADRALFDTIIEGLKSSDIGIVQDRRAINDDGFSTDMAKTLMHIIENESCLPHYPYGP